MATDPLQSFAEFWPFYVREHRRRATRFWHFCGTSLALLVLIAALVMRQWLVLLAVPVCGYAFAWLSHLLVEKNRPATFSYPLWSLLADFKMWALIATGRMGAEMERILGDS
jgi:hypothetical protein